MSQQPAARRFPKPATFTISAVAMLALAACGSESNSPAEPTAAENRGGTNGTTSGTTSGNNSGNNSGGQSGASSNTVASRCNGVLAAVTVDDVYVPTGASCSLNGTRVRGSVKVAFDGTLIANAARIDGNIQAEDARSVTTGSGTTVNGDVQVKRRAVAHIENTTIGGNLQIEEVGASLVSTDSRITGDVQVTKADRAELTRLTVNGDVQFFENSGAIRSDAAVVGGNMQIEKNRGGVMLLANRVRQVLECKENSPAPTGTGNSAGEKQEQCRAL